VATETAARTGRTAKKEPAEAFIEALRKTGNISAACRSSRFPRRTAYDRREVDPEFAAAWDAALDEAVDSLEKEAWRRATEGTLKPVFQGGAQVGRIREYSDTLLIFLLKGHRPERFRETVRQEHSGPGGKSIPVRLNLSQASDEELEVVERLYTRSAASADAEGDPPGEGTP
jgi:hypothetical protein